jgi:hypothetical protein
MIKTAMGAFLAATLTSACGSAVPNPCLVWVADNGPYLAKYTLKSAGASCAPGEAGDQYDTLEVTQYPSNNTVVILPDILVTDTGQFGERENVDTAHDPIASGTFDNAGKVTTGEDGNEECSVPTFTAAQQNFATLDPADGRPDLKYEFSNVVFLEEPFAQGSEFKADLTLTTGSCVAQYSVQAMGPAVGCVVDDDCAPLPEPDKGKALGSGIAPRYHTYCDTSAEAQALAGPGAGLCFFADAYPSTCPNEELEGAAGSSCQLGQSAAAQQAP